MDNELAGTETIHQEFCYLTDSPIGIELLEGFLIKGLLRFLAYFKQSAWREKHLLLFCKLYPKKVGQKRWRYVSCRYLRN
jgi:hypothetical protein